MAIPTFVDAGTGGAGTGGTITPAYPTTLVSGDLLLMLVTYRETIRTITDPGGWTLLSGPDSTSNQTFKLYAKVSNGTETGTVTVSITGSEAKIGRIYQFRGTPSSSYHEALTFDSDSGTTQNQTAITTLGADRLCLHFTGYSASVTPGSFTGETGGDFAEAIAEYNSGALTQSLQTANKAATGSISGGSMSIGSSAWGVYVLALLGSSGATYSKQNTGVAPYSALGAKSKQADRTGLGVVGP